MTKKIHLYGLKQSIRQIKASLWLPNTCEGTWLTVEMSAVHGFRHVWRQSREFAEGQQGFLLAEVPSLRVGLTVQGTMGLSWREQSIYNNTSVSNCVVCTLVYKKNM